jgi:hypothetical protein
MRNYLAVLLISLALSACAPNKVIVKNCKHVAHDVYECEEP